MLTNLLCGTEVKFDGKSVVEIITGRILAANATGICGNCDGNHTNDYVLENGTDVMGDTNRDTLIGNSWWDPQPDETEDQ